MLLSECSSKNIFPTHTLSWEGCTNAVPPKVAHPYPNALRLDVAARQTALLQILLVIVFGGKKRYRGDDLGDDRL